jgi:glycosyltransferase involved in cell wall biosynthesis
MIYIPNYVDTELFRPGERAADGMIEVLYPRRFDPYRGIYLMQEIVPGMLQNYPNLRFNFAIDQTYDHFTSAWLGWLESQLHRARIRYQHYPMDQMPSAYNAADIVVIPSISSEGTSLSALEAMACGKAIVSSNIGGLSNLILPNFNGKIVNPTVNALQAAIEEYINSEPERKMHGKNARRVVETAFTKKLWERQWTRLIQAVFGG